MRLLAACVVASLIMLGIVAARLWPRRRPEAAAPRSAAALDAGTSAPLRPGRSPALPRSETPGGRSSARAHSAAPSPLSASAAGDTPGATQPAVRWARDPARARAEQRLAAAQGALATDPADPAALRDAAAALRALGRWGAACRYLARLVRRRPDDAALRFEYASALMRVSRWVDAVHALRAVVARDPARGRAWYNLAIAHQALGHLEDARRAWDRAIELMPENPDAYARRGEVLLDLRRWSAAAADFEAALRRLPDDVDVALNLSLALWKLGRLEDARDRAARVVAQHPRHVPALNRLARLCWELFRSDPQARDAQRARTVAYCRRSLDIRPDQPAIRALLDAAARAGRNP